MSIVEYDVEIESLKREFLNNHPEWVDFVKAKDPALEKVDAALLPEMLMQYPGLTALAAHEKAHDLYNKGQQVKAMELARYAQILSGGIEIHPQTNLSWKTFIDHGKADVIGGDVSLGEGAMLYSNVVLGNFNGERDADGHRHPQIGKDATISTDVRIYGPSHLGDNVTIHPGVRIFSTDIGNNVVIGKNVILDHAEKIPDNSYVTAKGQEIVINDRSETPPNIVSSIIHWGMTQLLPQEQVAAIGGR